MRMNRIKIVKILECIYLTVVFLMTTRRIHFIDFDDVGMSILIIPFNKDN